MKIMVQLLKKKLRERGLLITIFKHFPFDSADVLEGISGYSKKPLPISG